MTATKGAAPHAVKCTCRPGRGTPRRQQGAAGGLRQEHHAGTGGELQPSNSATQCVPLPMADQCVPALPLFPTPLQRSCHYLSDPSLSGAVQRFLGRERAQVEYTMQVGGGGGRKGLGGGRRGKEGGLGREKGGGGGAFGLMR